MTLPGAIILAGALVAGAIIWTQRPAAGTSSAANAATNAPVNNTLPQISMAPVGPADHILGNPGAPIKIVEFSDPSCPYCQLFNPTMEEIMSEYGPGGQVDWVYRQYPLDKPDSNGNILHPNAGRQAEAFECAAALGGNTAFWAYEKAWFEAFPQDGTDETAAVDDAQIMAAGKSANLDPILFKGCIDSGKYQARVDAEYADGVNAGVSGTPYIVIITPTGEKIALAGAQSYDNMKNAIIALLSEVPAKSTGTATSK